MSDGQIGLHTLLLGKQATLCTGEKTTIVAVWTDGGILCLALANEQGRLQVALFGKHSSSDLKVIL
jgi:hypothetical protein